MFITAMAANPLAVNLASDALGSTISWGTWALAGALCSLYSRRTKVFESLGMSHVQSYAMLMVGSPHLSFPFIASHSLEFGALIIQ